MTVKELIAALSKLPKENEDKVVILGDKNTGWSNIEELKIEQCTVSIMPDTAERN